MFFVFLSTKSKIIKTQRIKKIKNKIIKNKGPNNINKKFNF